MKRFLKNVEVTSGQASLVCDSNRYQGTFGKLRYLLSDKYRMLYTALLLGAMLFLPCSAEAHHVPGAVSANAARCVVGDPTCLFTTSDAILIVGSDKKIHWSVTLSDVSQSLEGVYLSTSSSFNTLDINLRDGLPSLPANATGQFSGDAWLTAGTYYVAVAHASTKAGNYKIDYNPATTGDPHITTVNGVRYDFQAVGEFVLYRHPKGMEIQVRHTPVPTGGAVCVSINTAVAARVGEHRVTYEPNLNGVPDPSGLQLRIDGKLADLGSRGIVFGEHSGVERTSAPGGLAIDFPDGSTLFITPGWWASQGKWYLNLILAPASDDGLGIMGAISPRTWLPLLPDGTSMGPQPKDPHEQFVALNVKFADAWRVTNDNSLFDYAPETSTKTFTDQSWPSEQPPCAVPGATPDPPIAEDVAKVLCQGIRGAAYANCLYDVMITGNPGFATTYALSQSVLADAIREANPTICEPPTPMWKWILLGLLLGLLIALLICRLWRKKTT